MSEAVHFTRVEVREMPGFPKGGLSLQNLAPAVNVVYGPNASGKTTLVRAMQRALGSHDKEHHTERLEAGLQLADKSYEIDYRSGHVECWSGGARREFPSAVGDAVQAARDRYVLGLHELVQHEDEHDIVGDIVRQASGGYNLTEAAKGLDLLRDRPKQKSTPTKSYADARSERETALQRLIRINEDEERLVDLNRKRKEVEDAKNRHDLLGLALKALENKKAREAAKETADVFPKSLSKLTGKEWDRVTKIKEGIGECREKLALETQSMREAEHKIQETRLPESALSSGLDEIINTLVKRCEKLSEINNEIRHLQVEVRQAESRLAKPLASLGKVSIAQFPKLDDAKLQELFEFVKKSESLRSVEDAETQLRKWLDTYLPPAECSYEIVNRGITMLQRWLVEQQTAHGNRRDRSGWLIAAGVCAVFSMGMAFVHLSWLVLLLLAIGIAMWAIWPHGNTPPPVGYDIESEWSTSGFPALATWNAEEVNRWLKHLQGLWGSATAYEHRKRSFAQFEDDCVKHRKLRAQYDKEREEWQDTFGIRTDAVPLYQLAEYVSRAQRAQDDLTAGSEGLQQAQSQYDALVKTINADLRQYFATPTTDAAQASELARSLNTRLQDLKAATGECRRAHAAIQEQRRKLAELESERTQLFAELGLSITDEGTLEQWIKQLDAYKKAQDRLKIAEYNYHTAMSALSGHSELLEQTREELEAELKRCRDRSEERDQLERKIGDIEGSVRRAKEENALEAALAREATCLDELEAARDKDARQLVGNVLVNYLARQQRDFQHPGVFGRASRLFTVITQGRYELRYETGDSPAFRAFDTVLGQEQDLNELSSASRLQLLMAVRVAFVEEQEQERGYQLPLFFDETLANSDERRAQAIIETAIELARSGRQVFYLTAQHDEFAKWRRVLKEKNDIPYRTYDLAELRNLPEADRAPTLLEPPAAKPQYAPAPEGDDWQAYGRRLSVPPLHPRSYVGGLHLWYFVEDVEELFRLLSQEINTWGKLDELVKVGACEGLTPRSPLYLRAKTVAALLERLFPLCLRGRGKLVDRSVLANLLDPNHSLFDKVANVAERVKGDSRDFLFYLRSHAVPNLKKEKINEIESYLLEHGYVDERPVLDVDEIREELSGFVEQVCSEGLVTPDRVEQLFGEVTIKLPAPAETQSGIPCVARPIDGDTGHEPGQTTGQTTGPRPRGVQQSLF